MRRFKSVGKGTTPSPIVHWKFVAIDISIIILTLLLIFSITDIKLLMLITTNSITNSITNITAVMAKCFEGQTAVLTARVRASIDCRFPVQCKVIALPLSMMSLLDRLSSSSLSSIRKKLLICPRHDYPSLRREKVTVYSKLQYFNSSVFYMYIIFCVHLTCVWQPDVQYF